MRPPIAAATTDTLIVRLLPLAASLALGYHVLLFALDQWVFPWPAFPANYYLLNVGMAVVVLGLALWARAVPHAERLVWPLVIGLMTLAPLVSSYLLVPEGLSAARPMGLAFSGAGLVVRIMPVLFLALVLTTGRYGGPQVLLYSLGMGVVQGVMLLFSTPSVLNSRPVMVQLVIIMVEAVSFLIIGLFITLLMNRLRTQQAALAEANGQLRRYTSTLKNLTVSRERNRVARELHDTLAHTLSGLSVQLETVNAYWTVDPPAAQRQLHAAQDTARHGLQETRHALSALRASPLEDLGLALALRQLAETAAARANLHLDLTLPDPLPALPPELEQSLYRVAQEAIANVVYHARARALAVSLVCQPLETRLVIRDDGVGFDPAAPVSPGHFGLAGIRERAALIDGHLTVTSQLGRGTTMALCISEGARTG